MAKLLIEVETDDYNFVNYDLDEFFLESLFRAIREGNSSATFSATVTDDAGEIIRESE